MVSLADILGQNHPLAKTQIRPNEQLTADLNDKIRQRFGPSRPRKATHLSSLLYCLRKEWGKRNLAEALPEPDEELLFTWAGGLLFEAFVSEGERQPARAYCPKCHVISSFPNPLPRKGEQETCGVCGKRWIVFTPDWVKDGMVHESKQTRKSSRRGPENAPNWIEQVASYVMFEAIRTKKDAPGQLIVDWLMGGYGSKRKGFQPRPPHAQLKAYELGFEDVLWGDWLHELLRRKKILEGKEMPPLTGEPGHGVEARSPVYDFECGTCEVGALLGCENFVWDAEGREKTAVAEAEGADESGT